MQPDPKDDFYNDSLDDLLGGPSTGESKPVSLPQGDDMARIRAHVEAGPQAQLFQIPCMSCRNGRFISYTGRDVGPCYKCKGKGYIERKQSAATLAKQKEQRIKRAANRFEDWKSEHPAEAEWIESSKAGFAFAADMHSRIMRTGDLTDGQMAAVQRMAANAKSRAADRAAREAAAPVVDATKIEETFAKLKASGLDSIKLRFEGITMKPAGVFDGILIKAGYTNIGKIEKGKFIAFRACSSEQAAQVLKICEDPMAAAQAYGFASNRCCICNLPLTNKESVETGIGPICGGRVGWTPGRLKVTATDIQF